jgi:hypothetical protein
MAYREHSGVVEEVSEAAPVEVEFLRGFNRYFSIEEVGLIGRLVYGIEEEGLIGRLV